MCSIVSADMISTDQIVSKIDTVLQSKMSSVAPNDEIPVLLWFMEVTRYGADNTSVPFAIAWW